MVPKKVGNKAEIIDTLMNHESPKKRLKRRKNSRAKKEL